eukprot:TRINITY_DN9891_c0_g1_i1.p1 TRINITY_DN9891_c0_g1~~TRINITY_DN9891_c0_g1_i1.p1  ORF type:complete len:154 (-),score=47.25 TRINITY_DN9891_c0_g1_i1:69-473(-)
MLSASRSFRLRTVDRLQSSLTGIPEKQLQRKVLIYIPPKSAMQSGTSKTNRWQITFLNDERWDNPLMGWTSNADPYSNLKLKFPTKEKAIEYCQAQGFAYEIEEEVPKAQNVPPKDYGANFKYIPPKTGYEDLL